MHRKSYGNLLVKIFLFLAFSSAQTTKSHDFALNNSLTTNAGMRATIGCGRGAAIGSSFGPVGTITGIIIGGLIGFLVNKCTRKVDHKYDRIWFDKVVKDVNKAPTKTVEDILSDTKPGREISGKAKQYIKAGGYDEALKDFEDLGPMNIKNMNGKEWKVGILPDGRTVNVRVRSLDGRPTLEIQPVGGKGKIIKIRYEENF